MERDANKRFKLGINPEEHEMLRVLARSNGLDMSAYLRMLVRREWNASPHLHGALRVGEDDRE
jgi:hypothetical protein